jgi:PAS domain S-box-containing protein
MVQTITTRERELTEAKEQFEAVLNTVPGSIFWIDSQGFYIWVNRHFAEQWNLAQDAFIDQEIGFLAGTSELTDFIRQFLASSQESASQVIAIEIKQQKHYYFVAARKYQRGEATISVGIDITDRIEARKALQEKETLLQLVLDNIPQLIFWKDRNSVFQGCNQRWAKAVGIDNPDAIVGKMDYDLYSDRTNVDIYLEKDRQVIETGKPELHIEYKPEKDKWFDTKKIPIMDAEGNIVGILGTIEDITERKKAEAALRLAEENYRSIFENALEGIFQSTIDGRYLSVNPALARIYGYDSPEEMIANVTQIETQVYVDGEKREEFKQILAEKGEVKNWEYQVYCRDGRIIWIEENTRAVRDASGSLLYYEGIVEDITQRKQQEAKLQQQLQELRIEIDQKKRERQVSEITQTDYFQELQAEVARMQFDDDWFNEV